MGGVLGVITRDADDGERFNVAPLVGVYAGMIVTASYASFIAGKKEGLAEREEEKPE